MIDTSIQRVKISQVIENQLPEFVATDSPLFVDFLKQYYISQEYQGGPTDIGENIDRYTKLQTYVGAALTSYVGLSTDIESYTDTITVDSTDGWPKTYGLLKIDNEIISYTGITTNSFTGCLRGFSGIDNLDQPTRPDLLSFNTSVGAAHTGTTKVYNLSNLFIREFFNKLKTSFAPGFEDRSLSGNLNKVNFVRQVKDFYRTKGTEQSYQILFKALYGERVKVIKPSEFLLKPSDADYSITEDLFVKVVSGDPRSLKGSSLFQDKDADDKTIPGASGAISDAIQFVYGGESYYQVSLSKDSIDGTFVVPGRTRLVDPVSIGATVLTVDTTVGFPTSGILNLVNNGTVGVVTYTGTTVDQFVGLNTMTSSYDLGDEVRYGNVAYGYSGGSSKKVEVVITGVLKELNVPKQTYYINKGDKVRVGHLGIQKSADDAKFNSWLVNSCVRFRPTLIERISSDVFRMMTESPNGFMEEDIIEVIDAGMNVLATGRVSETRNLQEFILSDVPGVSQINIYYIRKKINRGNSSVHDNITKYTTNVQNVYDSDLPDVEKIPPHPHAYVAAPSIPTLGQQPIVVSDRSVQWSGGTVGSEIQITEGATDHGFYSGEVVTYRALSGFLGYLIDGKNYFVKRANSNNVQLANSLSDLVNDTYVDASGNGIFRLDIPELSGKKLEHQKLLKRIPITPVFDGNQYETIPGATGILVNGTEILNYKSGDVIFYGGVKSIDVLEGGKEYDVVNPPRVTIESTTGIGASATANVKGKFQRIDVLDGGFDYVEPPVVEITGGNGKDAIARSILKKIDHFTDFDASSTGGRINIGDNTIGFTTFHKFRDGEAIIYKAFSGTGAIGIASAGITTTGIQLTPDQRLVNNSVYYAARIDAHTIKLANNENDAITRSNIINITGFADGTQRFQSLEQKKVLGRIIVENSGENYENKRRLVPPVGVNTYSDFIEFNNHGFQDGELIRYSNSDGTAIGGLSQTQDYYVLKDNDNKFRLAAAGIGTTLSDANYKTNQYVDLESIGSGEHIFNYPPIVVNVKGRLGINTSSSENYHATVNPIVRGSITSINLEAPGNNYGASNVFNFTIPPQVRVSAGSSSEFKPIVSKGKIQSVIVTRGGYNYTSVPDLTINGDGVGAKIIAKVENGQVKSVTVANGGVGYSTSNVAVQETIPGTNVKILTKIASWNVDAVERNKNIIKEDDGYLTRGDNDNGMKFTSFYAPRELRKALKQKNSDNTKDYASSDLNIVNNAEELSTKHSPIIGWAYDGNPIYGPYGYKTKSGGDAVIMRSGYALKTSRVGGPPIDMFPIGFFIEDYEFQGNGDLDENNGRFCVTPDYPNGVYAYFATIDPNQNDASGPFKNFRAPKFPYLIGDKFSAWPDRWNFIETNNQIRDFNKFNVRRNTYPYRIDQAGATYEGIYDSRKITNQENIVNFASAGNVNKYEIENAGTDYKVKDALEIESSDGWGAGFAAIVSNVGGKEIVSIGATVAKIENIVFEYNNNNGQVTGFSSQPHGLTIGDQITVSGLSTDSVPKLDGRHVVGFNTNFLLLSTGIGTTGATGIITDIHISGNLSKESVSADDVLGISTERMLVMNVDGLNNKIKVKREFDGVVGTAHSGTSLITVLNRTINFPIGLSTDVITNRNISAYFNPSKSLALGSTAGVGIGSTIYFNYKVVGGITTSQFIPTQTLRLPDHGFIDGQKLNYSCGDTGIGISVYNGISTFTLANNTPVYAINAGKDFLGISTNPLGIGSTGSVTGIGSTAYRLFFSGYGSGQLHSFKPQKTQITGYVEKVIGTVVCKESHGLIANDEVTLSLTPGISTTVNVKYSDATKRTLINAREFGASAVNTDNYLITINDHGYQTGDKVFYTTSSAATPLVNHSSYFVVRNDKNSFRLAETYHKATKLIPETITITAAGSGHEISQINPPIRLTRGYTVGFAVSDTSLGVELVGNRKQIFDLQFFRDKNFTKPYYTNEQETGFQVTNVGTVGVTTTAKVNVSVTENTPEQLFYKLNNVNYNIIDVTSDYKKDPIVDEDVINYSNILVKESGYNGRFKVVGVGTTTFKVTLPGEPEKDSYTSDQATVLKYRTTATQVSGPIEKLQITSKGKAYKSIPVVASIGSTSGAGALIKLESDNIGILRRSTINNIGYDYSSDKTLEPTADIPQIIRLNRLSSINEIGITSGGKNYLQPPKIVVIDRITNQVNKGIEAVLDLQGTAVNQVNITNNAKNLYDSNPKIVAIHNSNGVSVKDLDWDSSSKVVTLTLNGTYTSSTYPFTIGKKVFVENIGIASTGTGYNSTNYAYDPFTVTGVNTNAGGGNATVSYKLDKSVTNPGIFSGDNSSATVVPFENMPIFSATVTPNDFSDGEIIRSTDNYGDVISWNSRNKYIKVISSNPFEVGDVISGDSSKSVAIIESVTRWQSIYDLDALSEVHHGWQRPTGELNNELQRVQDSDYYQIFSYSLNSEIPHHKWKDPVGSLGHVVGFKNFSDLDIVSVAGADSKGRTNAKVGVGSDMMITRSDLVREDMSLHTRYDFDVVSENSKIVNGVLVSDEIRFANRVLTDYIEARHNRAISIDGVSHLFNDEPRPTPYADIDDWDLTEVRSGKYYLFAFDKRYKGEKEIIQINVLHNGSFATIMPFGRVETQIDLGAFDFIIDEATGYLRFSPAKFRKNDYAIRLFDIGTWVETNATGIGSTTVGAGYEWHSTSTGIGSTTAPQALGIVTFGASDYSTIKLFAETTETTGDQRSQLNEMVIMSDGSELYTLEYAQMITDSQTITDSPSVGLGTFGANIKSGIGSVFFTPLAGVGVTMKVHQTIFAGASTVGIGSTNLGSSQVLTETSQISASGSPQATRISGFTSTAFQAADCLIEVKDTTNNKLGVRQVTLIHDGTDCFFSEYGVMDNTPSAYNNPGIGTIGVGFHTTGHQVELRLTPPVNAACTVKVLQYNMSEVGGPTTVSNYQHSFFKAKDAKYTGTENDIKFEFPLKHDSQPVFNKVFDSSSTDSVNLADNIFVIDNHFFTTGEKITYTPTGTGTTMSVGIGTTNNAIGIGTTDKLPSEVYVVKIAENKFKVAVSATDALAAVPKVLDLNAVGVGTTHAFTSQNLNSKMLVALDNNIQAPLIQSPITSNLSADLGTETDYAKFVGLTSFFSGDILRINDEYVKIDTVGIGSTNQLLLYRAQLNSTLAEHSAGATVTKYVGNYQVVRDTINFAGAPKGAKGPTGLTTTSTFNARAFIRTGIPEGSTETYVDNSVLDSIEDQFTGSDKDFILKSEGANVTGFSTNTGIILLNEIFQNPVAPDDYTLTQTAGITSISFTGAGVSVAYDVNVSSIPRGGVIVSVGETSSFGYQNLVSAGGTAVVSSAGTVSSVSIGNCGSGYRVGIQTNILVKARTSSGVTTIGTANVDAGIVTSVTITNGGSGYDKIQPPDLEFEPPLNYENMRLTGSATGIGASVSVVVGAGSSVIAFTITNFGYNYKIGDTLTLDTASGANAGIHTDSSAGSSFKAFELTVDETFNDSFSGWSFGQLQKINTFEGDFDGKRKTFTFKITEGAAATQVTLRAAKGSPIKIEDNIIVFINDILQVSKESYTINGGSRIEFSEAPKAGDKVRIYFYRGSDNDVFDMDILETIKVGDEVQINTYPEKGLTDGFQQNPRTVTGITTTDTITTNTYPGPGIATVRADLRPIVWTKQLSDVVIDNKAITKDRTELEAGIRPTGYIINSVSTASTDFFVDNAVPLFNEFDDRSESKQALTIFDPTTRTGAAATAVVATGIGTTFTSGTIQEIIISDGGAGFTTVPHVAIGVTAGIGTIHSGIAVTFTTNASAVATLSGVGTVSSIHVSVPGIGYTYTNPPSVLIAPQRQTKEKISSVKYDGDFGIITGIGTTTVAGIATTGLTFDLFIPLDSPLRDSSIMTTPRLTSGIQTGYYFVAYNTNTGTANTSYADATGITTVGIGSTFIDNIYKVMAVENVTGSAHGVGSTTLRRVTVSVGSTAGVSIGSSATAQDTDFGNYSWGRIYDFVRADAQSFSVINSDGVTGILTGPVIVRTRDLKEANI